MTRRVDFDDQTVATQTSVSRMPIQLVYMHLAFVKKNLKYPQVFSFYGMSLKEGTHQIRCPFHGADRNPSCRYYVDTQRIWCFACNEGGDVCWFVRKRQGFKTLEETFKFIRDQFGVSMDELDLNKRRAILPVVQSMPQKEQFAKEHTNTLNDVLLEERRTGFPAEKLDKLEAMFWQRKTEIDESPCDYMGYCNLIRGWSQWCQQLLQEAKKFNPSVVP